MKATNHALVVVGASKIREFVRDWTMLRASLNPRTSVLPSNGDDRDDGPFNRVRESFDRQQMMQTLGASLAGVRPGEVEIMLPFRSDLTQQHGYLHAAAITAIADSACGYAALTMMEPGVEVLSVEFKVNLLAPAAGKLFLATGRVVRSGRTLTVCSGEVVAEKNGTRKPVCLIQATMIAARAR